MHEAAGTGGMDSSCVSSRRQLLPYKRGPVASLGRGIQGRKKGNIELNYTCAAGNSQYDRITVLFLFFIFYFFLIEPNYICVVGYKLNRITVPYQNRNCLIKNEGQAM